MKKNLLFTLSLALIVVSLVGCSNPTPAPTAEPEPADTSITVVDSFGNTVTLAAPPERIVSLVPSHTEILYALGLGDQVVGVTEYCNYPPAAAEKPTVGGYSNIDLEQVIGLEPDLVLASSLHLGEIVPALQEHGLVVFVGEPQSVADTLATIRTIGELTGHTDAADALVADMQARIDAVTQTVAGAERPTVFWELGAELYTAGPGSFINDLIILAGGENIAADADSPWPQLSVEAIVLGDPDVVVLADHNYGETAEMVAQRPGWDDITAVQEGRIFEITDDDIFSRPGPRVVDALEILAAAFHPDLFE